MNKKIIQFIRTAEELEQNLTFAVNYAKKTGLEIELAMVIEQRYEYFYPVSTPVRGDITAYEFEKVREERIKAEEKKLKAFIENYSGKQDNPTMNYIIESGATDVVLNDYSKKDDTAFILINESQEPENSFIINTYLNIVENADCPVIKIPDRYNKAIPLKKILYATDYKEEDIPTLKRIIETASVFDSEITTLHITDSIDLQEKLMSRGFETSIKEKLGYEKIKLEIHKDKDAVSGVINFANNGNYDMIVVLKENRNFFQRIFTRSDSNKILSKSDIPVMVFHEKES